MHFVQLQTKKLVRIFEEGLTTEHPCRSTGPVPLDEVCVRKELVLYQEPQEVPNFIWQVELPRYMWVRHVNPWIYEESIC